MIGSLIAAIFWAGIALFLYGGVLNPQHPVSLVVIGLLLIMALSRLVDGVQAFFWTFRFLLWPFTLLFGALRLAGLGLMNMNGPSWLGHILFGSMFSALAWACYAGAGMLPAYWEYWRIGLYGFAILASVNAIHLVLSLLKLVNLPLWNNFGPTLLGHAVICSLLFGAAYGCFEAGGMFPAYEQSFRIATYGLGVLGAISAVNVVWGTVLTVAIWWNRFFPSGSHGSARFASLLELTRGGLIRPKGLFLGWATGRLARLIWLLTGRRTALRYGGESSILTIAPQGSGKTSGLVIPACLTYEGSLFITDPKGEIAAVTARHRKSLGHDIVILNPWQEDIRARTGLDVGDTPFNPLSLLEPDSLTLKDDAAMLADTLLPGKGGGDQYFTTLGRKILAGAMMWLTWRRQRSPTLPELREFLLNDLEELKKAFKEMSRITFYGGVLAQFGKSLLSVLEEAPKQFLGGHDEAQLALEIYDAHGPLGQHVSRPSEVDFGRLKQGKVTVYLVIPGDRRKSHGAWLDLVTTVAIQTIAKAPGTNEVWFVMDEFGNMGRMPTIPLALGEFRGQKLRFWFILQYLNQLQRVYPEDWKSIVAGCEVKQFFGVSEPDLLNLVSELCGTETVKAPSVNQSGMNVGEAGRKLIPPDEVRRLSADRQLMIYANLRPVLAGKGNYRRDGLFRGKADVNPYHVRPQRSALLEPGRADIDRGERKRPLDGATALLRPAVAAVILLVGFGLVPAFPERIIEDQEHLEVPGVQRVPMKQQGLKALPKTHGKRHPAREVRT